MNSLLANAKAYGFTETKIDAISDLTLFDKRFDGPGANYVFWGRLLQFMAPMRVQLPGHLETVLPLRLSWNSVRWKRFVAVRVNRIACRINDGR
ncbi:MAG TPA: hypothetical protein VKA81_00130, partial [Verrucomicrobiae bacterium]|nr:hypothetical protein [Verrucomicrobiae bacterium]